MGACGNSGFSIIECKTLQPLYVDGGDMKLRWLTRESRVDGLELMRVHDAGYVQVSYQTRALDRLSQSYPKRGEKTKASREGSGWRVKIYPIGTEIKIDDGKQCVSVHDSVHWDVLGSPVPWRSFASEHLDLATSAETKLQFTTYFRGGHHVQNGTPYREHKTVDG